jgi:hypothetical protein
MSTYSKTNRIWGRESLIPTGKSDIGAIVEKSSQQKSGQISEQI